MAVVLKSKYYGVLIFLHLVNSTRSMLTLPGTSKVAANSRSENVSHAQEHMALHWPKGIVTYYLDNLSYDQYLAQKVRLAMNVLEAASCMRFNQTLIKPAGIITWIHFTNPQGERNCVHEPKFKNDGEIILVLGFDCLKEHEILHTLLHAIGFKDEVSHPHRDQYVRVMWDNIQPEYRYLYRIRSSGETNSQLLVEYDPLSIMHFHDRAFSMNGHATVMPLVPGLLISPSDDLSQLDKMRLRLLFDHECNKRKVGDMIDTCRILLSNNNKPNDSKSVSDSKLGEKQRDLGPEYKVDEIDKTDEVVKTEEVGEVNKVDKSDKENQIDETREVEGQNQTESKGTGNHSNSNEHRPDAVLNIKIPVKVLEPKDRNEEYLENHFDLNEHPRNTVLNRYIRVPIKLLDYKGEKIETSESISVQDHKDAQKSDYDSRE